MTYGRLSIPQNNIICIYVPLAGAAMWVYNLWGMKGSHSILVATANCLKSLKDTDTKTFTMSSIKCVLECLSVSGNGTKKTHRHRYTYRYYWFTF
ncbi:hypothetical protein GDO86_019415 [Hymenochirus boettgeri]|uniref:Uncharacterized protein n=1 Tax=Hymenochirus boettgeri TaxID=247094 RepID=A0A8T2IG58_9PIPI|nr:hypothetical protein GDO86_019415 [Hymenochirus boettgeri]